MISAANSLSAVRAAMVAADFDFADCGAVTAIPAFLTALNATYTRPSVMNVLQGTSLVQLSSDQFGTHRDGVPVAYSEKNKLRFTQEFDNAFHTKTNLTVTANAANDSDGNATADKLCESSTSNVQHCLGSYTHLGIGVLQTFSIEARAAERTQVVIQLGSTGVFFNLSTGAVISGTGGTITALGGGLYRCSVTGIPTNANLYVFTAVSGSATYAGTVGYGLYVSKAQLEFGNLSAYERNYDGATGKYSALIEPAATNLLTYSQDFTNAVWSKGNITAANGATAPDGTSTATTLTIVSTNTSTINSRTAVAATATSMTYSIYVKAGTRTGTLYFLLRNSTTATDFTQGLFNPLTGAVTGSGWVSTPIGADWYRLEYTQSTGITVGNNLVVYSGFLGQSTGMTAGETWLVWGAQLESGTIATSYIATTGSTATRAVAKLLVPLWKNNFKYSTDLTNAYWTQTGVSSLVGGQSDPDGGTNAFLLTENSSTSIHLVNPQAAISGGMMNMRVIAKTNGRHLFMEIGGSAFAYINLTTGATISATGCTVTTASLGSGWWQCDIATTAASTSASSYIGCTNSTPAVTYAGDGTSGIYLYQPRIGNGSTPISFIPTTSTLDVTGNANIPGFSSSGYTLAADWRSYAARTVAVGIAEISDGSSTNRSNLLVSGSDLFNSNSVTGGVSQMSIAGSACTNVRRKGAASYQANNFIAANNGVALTADTSGSMPTGLTILTIGSFGSGTIQNNGPIFRLQLIPKVLTQAQLNGLTM